MLGGAIGANTFHHVVYAFEYEIVRKMDHGNRQAAQTKGSVAARAIEMGVKVVDMARAFV